MDTSVKFIMVFDNQIAKVLIDNGFVCIKEKINKNQPVYCFEQTTEILETLKEITEKENYSEKIVFVEDSTLIF